jgi:hypothetical protein
MSFLALMLFLLKKIITKNCYVLLFAAIFRECQYITRMYPCLIIDTP